MKLFKFAVVAASLACITTLAVASVEEGKMYSMNEYVGGSFDISPSPGSRTYPGLSQVRFFNPSAVHDQWVAGWQTYACNPIPKLPATVLEKQGSLWDVNQDILDGHNVIYAWCNVETGRPHVACSNGSVVFTGCW